MGLPQVDETMRRMGISDEDLDNLNNEMLQIIHSVESPDDIPPEEDEDESNTATFPFLNRLFGGGERRDPPPAEADRPNEGGGERARKGEKKPKNKYLEGYCRHLTGAAREGKLDPVIGRAQEIERVIQILNRRQKNNPCLIGEPGVGKTAIAEGLAQRIAAGDVPYKLRDKEL
jgi:ATP-dependent Clp protease ATP-binding subunit ClpA